MTEDTENINGDIDDRTDKKGPDRSGPGGVIVDNNNMAPDSEEFIGSEERESRATSVNNTADDSSEDPSENTEYDPYPGWGLYSESEFAVKSEAELEEKLRRYIEDKRKKEKRITAEMFERYCAERRDKIWYHALWELVFNIEDHTASKEILYEKLKEVTSKDPIDPISAHKFYFGLGFILRPSINGEKIVNFSDGKLVINPKVGVDVLTEILRRVGPPISRRPRISPEEEKKMVLDFLADDFEDI